MTVGSLETAKALVNEIGRHKVNTVFRYTNMEGVGEHYAVFVVGQNVDVFKNPFVIDPVLVYTMTRGWLNDG